MKQLLSFIFTTAVIALPAPNTHFVEAFQADDQDQHQAPERNDRPKNESSNESPAEHAESLDKSDHNATLVMPKGHVEIWQNGKQTHIFYEHEVTPRDSIAAPEGVGIGTENGTLIEASSGGGNDGGFEGFGTSFREVGDQFREHGSGRGGEVDEIESGDFKDYTPFRDSSGLIEPNILGANLNWLGIESVENHGFEVNKDFDWSSFDVNSHGLAKSAFEAEGLDFEEQRSNFAEDFSEKRQLLNEELQGVPSELSEYASTKGLELQQNQEAQKGGIFEGALVGLRVGLGFLPVVGQGLDGYEFFTGYCSITQEKLSTFGRVLSGIGMLLGTGQLYRAGINKLIRFAKPQKFPGQALPSQLRKTFVGGRYETVQLQQPTVLHHYVGRRSGLRAKTQNPRDKRLLFFTNTKYADQQELGKRLALDPAWGARDYVVSVRVPAGTWVRRGRAAPQVDSTTGKTLPGGGEQFVIGNVPRAWIISVEKAFKKNALD